MKTYETPKIEMIELSACDVITSSLGTETPRYDENDGIWETIVS